MTSTRDGSPTICTTLLQPQDRIARAPLGTWAKQLRTTLHVCLETSRAVEDLAYTVTTVGNNAALVAAHRGDASAAWRLCELQVCWLLRLSRRSRRADVARHGLQPWVNLARLEAMAGDWEAALTRLERLGQRRPDGILALQPLRADGLGCHALRLGNGDFALLVENVFVLDSLKALLLNLRWEEVLAFQRTLGDRRQVIALPALEAAVVAACRLGEIDHARDLASEGLRRSAGNAWSQVIFRLRGAEVAACSGNISPARVELGILARGVHALSAAARQHLQTQYVLARLSTACHELGCLEDAAALAGDLYHAARISGDEVFQIEAARLLADCAPPDEIEHWIAVRDGLESQTEYRRFRSKSVPLADSAALYALSGELETLFTA